MLNCCCTHRTEDLSDTGNRTAGVSAAGSGTSGVWSQCMSKIVQTCNGSKRQSKKLENILF